MLELRTLITVDKFTVKCHIPPKLYALSLEKHGAGGDEKNASREEESRVERLRQLLTDGISKKLGLQPSDIVDVKFLF